MRVQNLVVLVAICVFIPAVALGDSITRISPDTLYVNTFEEIVAIYGSGLRGTDSTAIQFSGPGGTYTLESSGDDGSNSGNVVFAWVPSPVAAVKGTWLVSVLATDIGGQTRVIGPAPFNVIERPLDGPPLLYLPEWIVAEAESVRGSFVSFSVAAFSQDGTMLQPACSHQSGALFPLGTTRVSCSATDSGGTATEAFSVTIVDTDAPKLTLPGDIVTTNPVVFYEVSATDTIDGNVLVECNPSSGSTFVSRRTTVACVAVDSSLNVSKGSFNVTVDSNAPPPSLVLPEDISREATNPNGEVISYVARATGGEEVICTPPSGSTFYIGNNPVDCTATNGGGTSTGSFNIAIVDTTPPVLRLPADMTVNAPGGSGANVSFVVSATDLVSGNVLVDCLPPSGSFFANGTTVVRCAAQDARQNESRGSFRVTVVGTDPRPPVLSLPGDIIREATGPAGAAVSFTATATDPTDGNVAVTCSPVSGSTFAIATTTVNCSATDSDNHTTTGSFKVTVRDTTAPVLVLPANMTVEATSSNGAVVAFVTSATDLVDGNRSVTCMPPSGSTFALGTKTVQCNSADTRGNTAIGSFTVTVRDTTPPVIVSVSATPNVLWPPNHQMVAVAVTVTATDLPGTTPTSRIISVSSSQADNGLGDGDTPGDIQITGALTLNLRAERAGNADRVYTITVETVDGSGNASQATVEVKVTQTNKGRATR